MAGVWFGVLGPVVARDAEGAEVSLGGPKVRVLLGLLLTEVGRVVSTERLIAGIYGDEPPEGSANALQSQVSRLRRAVGGTLVELHPAGYRLAIEPSDVDLTQFEQLAAAGKDALSNGHAQRAERLLGEALALWRGPAEVDADRLAELRLNAIEDHVEAQLAVGNPDIARLRELTNEHPLRERLRGQLMRALAASGRQAEALTVFEDTRQMLADELGADPSAELAQVHVEILGGQSNPASGNPVPAQLTSFVGRRGELAMLSELIATKRLVTLTGPGGTGKTRLAIEVSSQVSDVCFVEFAEVSDELPQVVLTALGVREPVISQRQPTKPIDRLVAALADRTTLLVFDNCEHVIEAAANLAARLLKAHANLRILATSREPLGITGEALFPVPRLETEPATRLFTDRARAVRADFAADIQRIASICEALDGLPLAIELAAARVRSLSVEQVAARLEDRFSLLSKGSRTAEARHRTLRAVVEWSWDLLEEDERTLATRLTVFAGGATLTDAERVCGLPDTLDLLTSLADKSLLEVAGERYRMLETIRAFCTEQLADEPVARRKHAEHFVGFAEEASQHLLGADQLGWLGRLEAEHDNLHAALRWACEADPDLALRLVGALSTYWWMRGRRFDGAQLCHDLAIRIGPKPPAGLTEEFMLCVLNALSASEDLPAHLKTVQEWGATRDAPPKHPFTTVLLAPVVGPPPPEIGKRLIGDDPWSQAMAPLGYAYQELFDGNVDSAERLWTDALARFRAIGESWGTMQCLSELGTLTSWRGRHAEAIAMVDEAIRLVGPLGATEDLADMLTRRGDCLLRAGDLVGATTGYQQVLALAARSGAPGLSADARIGLAKIDRLAGNLPAARERAEQALSECGTGWFGPDWARSHILVELGWIAYAESDSGQATSWLAEAMAYALRWGHLPLAAEATEALAGVALLEGDGMRAARLLGAGAALRGIEIAESVDVARVRAAAVALISEDAFAVGYAAGSAMNRSAALAESGSSQI